MATTYRALSKTGHTTYICISVCTRAAAAWVPFQLIAPPCVCGRKQTQSEGKREAGRRRAGGRRRQCQRKGAGPLAARHCSPLARALALSRRLQRPHAAFDQSLDDFVTWEAYWYLYLRTREPIKQTRKEPHSSKFAQVTLLQGKVI